MRPWLGALLAACLLASAADVTPPVVSIIHVQPFIFHFLVTVNLNEVGTVFCGTLINGGGGTITPSISQLKTNSGLDGHGQGAVSANTPTNILVTGLSPGTIYDLYCYAEDSNLNGISLADIAATRQAEIGTAAGGDYTPPTISYVSPYNLVEATKVTVYTQMDEDGTVWCVAREDAGSGTVQPTSAEIRDNVDVDSWATGTITAAGSYQATLILSGLTADTTYDYYCFAEDVAGNGIDGTPAFTPDPSAVAATKRTVTTLNILIPSTLQVITDSGSTDYSIEPASWNVQLPNSFASGCQERRFGALESWGTAPELQSAKLLSQISDAAKGCRRLPAAPRGGGPYVILLRRGSCPFSQKAIKAQDAGYEGILVVDYQTSLYNGQLPDMTASASAEINIPGWIIGKTDGEAIGTAIASASTGLVTINVADVYRKTVLGNRMTDVFGTRLYVTQ